MLWKRVLSALVLAPFFIFCLLEGGTWFFVLASGLSLLGLREYFDLLGLAGHRNQRILGYLWTAAIYAGLALAGAQGVLAAVALAPNLFILKYLNRPEIDGAALENAHTFYGVIAYSLPLSFLVLLRNMQPSGLTNVVWLVVLIWVQDTAAYFWGRALGRHKLQPYLSPKKTWEGAILGLLTALGAVFLASQLWLHQPLSSWLIAGLALTGVSAQLGDLNESLLKRNVGAKDSGHLIPGHGGILDRFDSFTFAAPVMYYVVRVVQ